MRFDSDSSALALMIERFTDRRTSNPQKHKTAKEVSTKMLRRESDAAKCQKRPFVECGQQRDIDKSKKQT